MPVTTAEREDLKVEKIIVLPPDGGWGWVVVGSAFYCIFIMDGIANTFSLLIPIFQKEFNATVSQISIINSLFTGFYFIFAPVAGSLSNRFGFRAVIIAGSLISSTGIAVSILTSNVPLMSATYGLIGGLGFSMMYINVVLSVGFYFERWRALATGITVSASGVGTLSFAPVVQLLLQEYTWRHLFIGYAICLEEPEKLSIPQVAAKNINSMHNTKYPTAAEALDLNLNRFNESRGDSRSSSLESFEIFRYNPSRKTSRNVEMRRHTEFSQLESIHDLTVPGPSSEVKHLSFWRKCCTPCRFRCKKCCRGDSSGGGVRPLYREDIFYEGSLLQLPDYDRNSTMVKSSVLSRSVLTRSIPSRSAANRSIPSSSVPAKYSMFYHLSVSRLPTRNDLLEERDGKCHMCPESITRALKTLFDFRVMRYPLFLLFTISTCFLAAGVNVPSYFTYVRAVSLGVMKEVDASLILTAMGVTNTVGRIICGLLGSVPRMNMILLHFVFLFFGAVLNVAAVFLHSQIAFFVYAALYGFVLAEQGSLRSVILVQLVGLEKLTNAFGILLLFLGIFTVVGTPAAGYMKDLFASYDAVFFFSSACLFLAALTLIPLLWVRSHFRASPPMETAVAAQNTEESKRGKN